MHIADIIADQVRGYAEAICRPLAPNFDEQVERMRAYLDQPVDAQGVGYTFPISRR
jgi:hypothetical protein